MTAIRHCGLLVYHSSTHKHTWTGYSPSTQRDFSVKLLPGGARWALNPFNHEIDRQKDYDTLYKALDELMTREADLLSPEKLFFYKPRNPKHKHIREKTTRYEFTIMVKNAFFTLYFRDQRVFAFPRIEDARKTAATLLSLWTLNGTKQTNIKYPIPLNPINSRLLLEEFSLIRPVWLNEDPDYSTLETLTFKRTTPTPSQPRVYTTEHPDQETEA